MAIGRVLRTDAHSRLRGRQWASERQRNDMKDEASGAPDGTDVQELALYRSTLCVLGLVKFQFVLIVPLPLHPI